jgi:hypothetical protein
MRRACLVAHVGEECTKSFGIKNIKKDPPESHRRRREDNIKMDLRRLV